MPPRDERRKHGVHYTTEALVLRVLRPLLLDDLDARLRAASTVGGVRGFLEHLASLTFFDPACGTGNFLVVAYRALRQLEKQAWLRLLDLGVPRADILHAPTLGLHQFYGIERDGVAAVAARENLERAGLDDNENGLSQSQHPVEPIGFRLAQGAPHIVVANALRIDWNDVLPASRASFVFGNPPFVGMAWMTPEQQEDRRHAFAFTDTAGLRIGRLDYAASFFAKSIAYGMGHSARFAYVVTNSLCQGEHPRSLGPLFKRYGYHVDFAYRPFPWTADESKKARVHVVIVGFSRGRGTTKRLFDARPDVPEPLEKRVSNINLFLTEGPDVFPSKRATPLRAGYPLATKGSQPTDGGHLVVELEDLDEVLADPIAAKYVRRYMQASEFLWDIPRHCLWLVDAPDTDIEASPVLHTRAENVKRVRAASRTPQVRERASTPGLFTQIRQPNQRYLALPEVSSEKRRWIPAAFLEPEIIAGNKLIVLPGADAWVFGMLQSSMFMAWLRTMAGRLKSDISISPDLTYCTFPFPEVDLRVRERVIHAAECVLQVRTMFAGKSLGDLYEPRRMPDELVQAHAALDAEVDGVFGKKFGDDAERVEMLLERYEEVCSNA